MSLPAVVSRAEWREARRQLLAREKEATRQRDALNAERRRLPMVRIDAEYVFEGPQGKATLADLFGGRQQLILRDGGDIFHTYSTYARGTDQLGSTYTLLDLTALGRQENWEEPQGRAPRHGADPTFTD
jgi:predicted dithiol-disulfide oxidoreductase (DUF899 family)